MVWRELALYRSYPRLIALEPTPLESPGLGQMISQNVVSKAYGMNADQLSETIDNTGIYKLMYETLFDTEIPDQGARMLQMPVMGRTPLTPFQ